VQWRQKPLLKKQKQAKFFSLLIDDLIYNAAKINKFFISKTR
jgi:hypothetical protein